MQGKTLSQLNKNSRGLTKAAGVLFFGLWVNLSSAEPTPFSRSAFAVPESLDQRTLSDDQISQFDSYCYTGFTPHPANKVYRGEVSFNQTPDDTEYSSLDPQVTQWIRDQGWSHGYELWLNSLECQAPIHYAPHGPLCNLSPPREAQNAQCGNKQDSFDFLVMHRHLLQAMRSVWPDYRTQFSSWQNFPTSLDDYPEPLQNQFSPWPDTVVYNAKLLDRIPMLSHQELLSRWPTEADLAHWILCGTTEANMQIDSLYGAMMSQVYASTPKLESFLFWQFHSWINRVWDKYRMRIGKMPFEPAIQGELIKQCTVQEFWTRQSPRFTNNPVSEPKSPVFVQGQLNPAWDQQPLSLLAEIEEIVELQNGSALRINPKRIGVESIWVWNTKPLDEDTIKVGEPYVFYGRVALSQHLNPPDPVPSVAVLRLHSIFSPK